MVGITAGESFGQFWLFGCAPLELVGVQDTVDVLQIIDFLLLLGSPKITFPIKKAIGIVLCINVLSYYRDTYFHDITEKTYNNFPV